MKNNYFNSMIFGIVCLILSIGPSPNTLYGDNFRTTTEIVPHDFLSPPATGNFNNVLLQDFSPAIVDKIVIGGTFQSALNCAHDWDPNCENTQLTFNSSTGLYTGTFEIPAGNNRYKVAVGGSWDIYYGENGILGGADIFLCVPSGPQEITFTYDPGTNLVTTSPILSEFSPECLPQVVLAGSFQDELGCYSDWVPDCTNTALTYNAGSGLFEGDLNIPTGCYEYRVILDNNWEISFGQNGIQYGPNYIISIPENPEITHFTYDPVSHIVSSTPYDAPIEEVTKVSLIGSLQDELGCAYDYDYECDNPALLFNPNTGTWEGSFTLPSGCYTYRVKETFGCNVTIYGENGGPWGNEIQLYVPTDGEVTFSYEPETHIVISTSLNAPIEEVTKVSLIGTLQDELGCAFDYDFECDNPALQFNSNLGVWEGTFSLPAGCYTYYVKETSFCGVSYYGENGMEWGNEIQLYVPVDEEITFSYDPKTHLMSSTPYSGAPQEAVKVSLFGTLQNELGCAYDYEYECNNPELVFNQDLGVWEGSFILPAGCYAYRVKETSLCNTVTLYGENGFQWGSEIPLYIPSDAEITFRYDPHTHIITSTPYFDPPQEVTGVSFYGTLQSELGCTYDYNWECNNSALQFNPASGAWEGSFALPAGCYTYYVKETIGCNNLIIYGENGIEWGTEYQLYITSDGEVTFSYNPETHIMSSTPNSIVPQEVTRVSLMGSLQEEFGCDFDFQFDCDNPALQLNPDTGLWNGSFTLPVGCYTYYVKETFGCNSITFYGENGIEYGDLIQLYVPTAGEITFSYDPQTHILSSTPYVGAPQELTIVSLLGSLQDELGCTYDYQFECDKAALLFNPISGVWEGSFTLPVGCYTYYVKETIGCNSITFYGENGIEWGTEIQLYVPKEGEITFRYDPQTRIISSTPYTDINTVNQCPANISVNNSPGLCGTIVDYPEIVSTANCGGEILTVTQTAGLSSGSFFPVGITTNTFLLTKTTGEELICSFDVVVTDTESPVISGLKQSQETLWPPNHKMVPIFLEYFTSDNCGIATTELYISSNEPVNGPGDGNTAPDWEILDEHNVLLRAERSAKGNGREYYITIKVTDSSGISTEQFVIVTVPHDNGKMTNYESGNDKYTLYPNATEDIINIKGPKSTSNSAYVIYDMLGVMKKQGFINNEPIDVRTLPSGVYIFKFETAEGYMFKKFIKN